MNGAIFIEYLQQCLLPTLRPGDVVIIDNLPAHKRGQVRQIIEGLGLEIATPAEAREILALKGGENVAF